MEEDFYIAGAWGGMWPELRGMGALHLGAGTV